MKHIASNVLIYIKNNCISMFLVFSALLMCLVHAIPAAVWADFFAINGDFQNYNVVRRFLDGQTIYTDFAAYLGYGHLLIGSVLTFIFGAGDPTLSSSKMAFCFAAILAFALWSYAVYWAVFHKYGKVIPLIATNIMLLLILVDPAFFANVMSLTADLHQAMQGSLATGNSARFLRELAPVIFVFMCVFLYWLKGRIKLINQSESLSLGFVFGIPSGIIFYYSNDYGVSSVVSVTVIICLSILFKKEKLFTKLNRFYSFAFATLIAFVIFGFIITKGHFTKYLSATFGIGNFQAWYTNGLKSYYIWDMDLSFLTIVQAAVVVIYLVVFLSKKHDKENIIRYGVPLFFNMTAYAATNEYKLLSDGYLHEVSYTVLYLTLSSETIHFVFGLFNRNNRFSPVITGVVSVFVALSGIAWSVSFFVPLHLQVQSANRSHFVKHLGYFANQDLGKSIESTNEFMKDSDVVFSTYASALEAYRNKFQPTGIDYMNHVLGDRTRSEYVKSFHRINPSYVATIRESYTAWEYWIRMANWFFYRELYRNYTPAYANFYQLFWVKSTDNQIFDKSKASYHVEHLDDHTVRISVNAPSLTFGVADVSLKYKATKKTGLRSLFVFNTMVLSSNVYGTHNLPKEGDGTNTSIGIPIVNGTGSAVLTSLPQQDTKFEKFEASLVGVYDKGFFNSVVVLNTENKADGCRITIANSPDNQKIVNGATRIRINGTEYKAAFTSDEKNIFIDTASLDNKSKTFLEGHSYFPVIQVI